MFTLTAQGLHGVILDPVVHILERDKRKIITERESRKPKGLDEAVEDGIIQAQRNGKGTFLGCSPTLLATDYKQVPLVVERGNKN